MQMYPTPLDRQQLVALTWHNINTNLGAAQVFTLTPSYMVAVKQDMLDSDGPHQQ